MRGKVSFRFFYGGVLRITPAYAGKRRRGHSDKGQGWDHPRLCGEKETQISLIVSSRGSPPPMRGKGQFLIVGVGAVGITPAYAGKSCRHSIIFTVDKDHPRLCGEKPQQEDTRKNQRGSPPPMRGKDQNFSAKSWSMGITPAYAGKSRGAILPECHSWDHPRLCGEK